MQDHLSKAAEYVAKGDAYYAKAREEILKAMDADPSLGAERIGKAVGKSATWVRNILNNPTAGGGVDWKRGGHATKQEIRDGALALIEQGDAEIIQAVIAQIDEDADRRARGRKETTGVTDGLKQARGAFSVLSITTRLDQVAEDVSEMITEGTLSAQGISAIRASMENIDNALSMAIQLVSSEGR